MIFNTRLYIESITDYLSASHFFEAGNAKTITKSDLLSPTDRRKIKVYFDKNDISQYFGKSPSDIPEDVQKLIVLDAQSCVASQKTGTHIDDSLIGSVYYIFSEVLFSVIKNNYSTFLGSDPRIISSRLNGEYLDGKEGYLSLCMISLAGSATLSRDTKCALENLNVDHLGTNTPFDGIFYQFNYAIKNMMNDYKNTENSHGIAQIPYGNDKKILAQKKEEYKMNQMEKYIDAGMSPRQAQIKAGLEADAKYGIVGSASYEAMTAGSNFDPAKSFDAENDDFGSDSFSYEDKKAEDTSDDMIYDSGKSDSDEDLNFLRKWKEFCKDDDMLFVAGGKQKPGDSKVTTKEVLKYIVDVAKQAEDGRINGNPIGNIKPIDLQRTLNISVYAFQKHALNIQDLCKAYGINGVSDIMDALNSIGPNALLAYLK